MHPSPRNRAVEVYPTKLRGAEQHERRAGGGEEDGATAQAEVFYPLGGAGKKAGNIVDAGFSFAKAVICRLRQFREEAQARRRESRQ